MADTAYLVDKGIELLVNNIVTDSIYKYIAWGTGTTAAVATNTAMETAAAPTTATAVTGTPGKATTSTTDDTYTVTGTITAGGSLAITEVGIFNQATISGASMFFRGTFSAINVSNLDSIQFTLKTQFNQA